MAMVRSRIFSLIALVLGCSFLASGCLNHSRLPSEAEKNLIQQHNGTIVLLHLRTMVDGKPREDIRLVGKNKDYGFGFTIDIGKLDPGQSPDLTLKTPDTALISPSAEARRKGWIYYVLPPGNYYLKVYDMEKKGTLAPGFLLTVSGEKQLIYAGTLDIACKRGPWSHNPPQKCSGVSLTDEGDAAQSLAQTYFAQYGPVSTVLMSKYSEAVAASQRGVIFPMGYTSAGTKDLASPDWVKRSMQRSVMIMSEDTMRGLADGGHIGWAILSAYVAYLPVGLAIGAISGKVAEKKWQPCLKELDQEIKQIDLAGALQSRLGEGLKKFRAPAIPLSPESDIFQAAARQGLKSLLQVGVQRVQIRECQDRGSFCLEVSLRARLWKIPEKTLYFDKALVHTSSRPYERISSEIQVPGTSPCRGMEAYCGPQGKRVIREEIAAAIPNLVARLLDLIGQS
jgi:hypothetical protein